MDMRITSKGQVTIPQAIRERYGFMPETDIEFVEREGWIGIQRADSTKPDAIQLFLDQAAGSATTGLSADQIMALTRDYGADD